jgi:hypothetical protein
MTRQRLARIVAVVAIAGAFNTQPAPAQEMTNVYLLDGGAFTNALMANSLVDRMEWATAASRSDDQARAGPERKSPSGRPAATKPTAPTFSPQPGIDTAHAMASAYPTPKRAEAEATFRKLLVMFGQIERQYGQPRHDLATAAALFIGSSHEAATGREFRDSYSLPLIRQMQAAFSDDPAIAGATNAEKQKLYEQFAIIGMMVGGTTLALKNQPNAAISARLKAAGNTYLRQFLKLDPARLSFTPNGMTLAAAR